MSQDRLICRGSVFNLINQRLLEDGFFKIRENKRPIIETDRPLTKGDYSCDWMIKNEKLYIVGMWLDETGADLMSRAFPGSEDKIHAKWFSGCISATNVKSTEDLKLGKFSKSELRSKKILFYVHDGYICQVVFRKLP